jgi:glycosyltransferase involved in cell wall biosynthesis
MKILQINYGWPPVRGGIIRYLYYLCFELTKLGHEVRVFFPGWFDKKEKTYLKHSFEGKVKLLALLNTPNKPRRLDDPLSYIKNESIDILFETYLEEEMPDIAHIHTLMGLTGKVIEILKRKKIPILFTLSNYWYICPELELFHDGGVLCEGPDDGENCFKCSILKGNRESLRNNIKKWKKKVSYYREILNKGDLIIAISRYVREKYVKFGIKREKFIILPLVSKVVDFAIPKEFYPSFRKITFGFYTTLVPYKGPQIAISAFKKLLKKYPDFDLELHLYGYMPDGHFRRKLFNLMNGEERIKYRGPYDYDTINNVFKEIDVALIVPIWEECQGLVIQEALAAKLLVVASRIGGIPEVIKHRKNGFLVKPNSVTSLYRMLSYIVENPDVIRKIKLNIEPLKGVREHAKELSKIYNELALKNVTAI